MKSNMDVFEGSGHVREVVGDGVSQACGMVVVLRACFR